MDGKEEAQKFFDSLPDESNEVAIDFSKELGKQADEPQEEPKKVAEAVKREEEEPAQRTTRRERRDSQMRYYEEQIAKERAERELLAEQVKKLSADSKQVEDPRIKKLLYEVKDPAEGSALFKEMLQDMRKEAVQDAFSQLNKSQEDASSAEQALVDEVEDNLELVEDKYGVDLSDDTDTRNDFLDFMKDLSSDESFANFDTGWRLFSQTRKAPRSDNTRAKQIASRGMVKSTVSRLAPEKVMPLTRESLDSVWSRIIGKS